MATWICSFANGTVAAPRKLMIAAGYQSAVPLCAIDAGKIPGNNFSLSPIANISSNCTTI
jgi:hypothetical protein